MSRRPISLVAIESVSRVLSVKLYHHPIAMDLGEDGSGRDVKGAGITFGEGEFRRSS